MALGRAFIRSNERQNLRSRPPSSQSVPFVNNDADPTPDLLPSRPICLVIASASDTGAKCFSELYGDHGVTLVTPQDLARSGWNYVVGHGSRSTASIGERSLEARDVRYVVTRLSRVRPDDLTCIVPEDRTYVAAEMTAFLLAWLSELGCPVINRPTPRSLSGPGWSHEEWVQNAVRIGVPIEPARRRIPLSGIAATNSLNRSAVLVTVVGRRTLGRADPTVHQAAIALAQAAGTELLSVRFDGAGDGARVLEADPWVDLGDDETREAVAQHMTSPAARPTDGETPC